LSELSELESVGVAELKVSNNSVVMASFGLGSCVAIAMFDPFKKVGGLAHVMLPKSRGKERERNPAKFADTAVTFLVDELVKKGARIRNLRCKIVGGSQMFEILGSSSRDDESEENPKPSNIGARNVEAVKRALKEMEVPLIGEDTGGNYGRTVRFNTSTGGVEVSSINHGRTVI
jgi:chemotaxis protein CheD